MRKVGGTLARMHASTLASAGSPGAAAATAKSAAALSTAPGNTYSETPRKTPIRIAPLARGFIRISLTPLRGMARDQRLGAVGGEALQRPGARGLAFARIGGPARPRQPPPRPSAFGSGGTHQRVGAGQPF